MSRSKWKGPYFNTDRSYNFNNILRNTTITPILINSMLNIHNGLKFVKLKIDKKMIGKKIGEFVPTRKNFSFKKK